MAHQQVVAGVYLRQSLDATGEGLAVERQRQACLQLCEQKGWQPVEYVDNSVSANSGVRKAYQQMLKDIAEGELQAVVVWDLDRLHRQPMELEHFIQQADKHELLLATVSGDVDLSTDNGRLFARIKGAVGKSETDRKAARQRAAHAQRAQRGEYWSTQRPFGYDLVVTNGHRTLEPRPDEAPLVRQIYEGLVTGAWSQRHMARDLNAQGVRTAYGKEWTQAHLRYMVQNPRYAGLRVHRTAEQKRKGVKLHDCIVGKGDWPAIISEEVYRAAVAVLSGNARTEPVGGKHLLAGVVFCGACGARCISSKANAYRGREGYRSYRCEKCNAVNRKAEPIEDLVVETLIRRYERPDAADLLLAQTAGPGQTDMLLELEALKGLAAKISKAWGSGAMDDADYFAALEANKSRRADISRNLARVDQAMVLKDLCKPNVRDLWPTWPFGRQQAVVRTSGLRVTLVPNTRRGAGFKPEGVQLAWGQIAEGPSA